MTEMIADEPIVPVHRTARRRREAQGTGPMEMTVTLEQWKKLRSAQVNGVHVVRVEGWSE